MVDISDRRGNIFVRMNLRSTLSVVLSSFALLATAQCPSGESEVTIEVITDNYGYETYWELLPSGSPCGTGTIFSGGNALVGCNGAGAENQPNGGYPSNATITEGPWCLTNDAQYDIFWADDWGDNGASFNVIVNGNTIEQFVGLGATDVFTFTVNAGTPLDLTIHQSRVPLFTPAGRPVTITGDLRSLGTTTVTSMDLNYSINGGTPVVMNMTGLSITPFSYYTYSHDLPWIPAQAGNVEVAVWASNLNGQADEVPANDVATTQVRVLEPIPQIIDLYLSGEPVIETIADDDHDLLVPRDLDFHPDPDRNELWVINKDVENTGGSTVRFFGPGESDMTFQWQRDPNAWHFMSLPSGIAFADNNNFSTCPGVFDANHNGAPPFTGISLWNSDPAVYAQPGFGPLGSHIDMVHANPNCQGIAHESWNRFWVVDGYNGDITMNDFRMDHGPGMDFHDDAFIRRYRDFSISKDPNDHIVSHTVLDKNTGWLYVVDHGGQRVLRMDINTGEVSGPGADAFTVFEPYDEYSIVSGYTWEVVANTGLIEPAGIEVIGDRLLVSDHATGEIIIYDIAASGFPELGRIATGQPGIMGITVGPDGHIWYVNATLHQLGRIAPETGVGIAETIAPAVFNVFPNPADDRLYLPLSADIDPATNIELIDMTGRSIAVHRAAELHRGLDLGALANGSYTLRTIDRDMVRTARFVVKH